MSALVRLLFGVIASTLASVAVVVALVSGVTGLWPLLACAAAGGVVALPISIFIAKRMTGYRPPAPTQNREIMRIKK